MSALGGLAQGFMQGYAFVDGIKQKKKDRERDDEEYRQRQADREAKKQQQAAAADIISRVGTKVEEADIGGGIKTTGPQAGARAQQIIDDGALADPEFGLNAQAKMGNPAAQGINVNAAPKEVTKEYRERDMYQDLSNIQAQSGDVGGALKLRDQIKMLDDEGYTDSLQLLAAGNVQEAVKKYNSTGRDRIANVTPNEDGTYTIVEEDGDSYSLDPKQQLSALMGAKEKLDIEYKKSQIDATKALAEQRRTLKLGTGQVAIDPETGKPTAYGPFRPASVARGGTTRVDNSIRFRAETIRKTIAQNDKILQSHAESGDRKKAAAEDNARLNSQLMGLIVDGDQPIQQAPAAPEVSAADPTMQTTKPVVQEKRKVPIKQGDPEWAEYMAARQRARVQGGEAKVKQIDDRAREMGWIK